MSKTLTEQWCEGTLRGCFYWKLPNGNICTAYTDTMRDIKNVRDSDEVEVLQETPSYVEYNELVQKTHILEKKLAIATKALKETKDRLLKIELSNLNYEERHKLYDIMFADGVIDRALLEIEGVK